jgi:predicted DNA-binding transcriptional regulator AlpA
MQTPAIPKLLDEQTTASLIGVARSTLAIWRSTKRYPLPYIKCGRLVRYREEDVAAFIEARRVTIPIVQISASR